MNYELKKYDFFEFLNLEKFYCIVNKFEAGFFNKLK